MSRHYYNENCKPCVVYLATNKVNGKQYVGITENLESRIYHHAYDSRFPDRCQAFQRAIRKGKPLPRPASASDVKRFVASFDEGEVPVLPHGGRVFTTPCWIWRGRPDRYGYPRFKFAGEWYGAHRVAYHIFRGPLTPGLEADHTCHQKMCVNPDHLELRRPIENRNDQLHGDQFYGRYAPQPVAAAAAAPEPHEIHRDEIPF